MSLNITKNLKEKIIVILISPFYMAIFGTLLLILAILKERLYFKGLLALIFSPILSIGLFTIGLLESLYILIYE